MSASDAKSQRIISIGIDMFIKNIPAPAPENVRQGSVLETNEA